MTKKKKEEVIDFTKPEKITDNQLKRVQDIVNSINRGQMEIGAMELQKHELMHKMVVDRDKLTVLQSELEKEYSTTDINIHDGTINYPKNGEVNKED
jgi:ethanolamine utilization protein EutQ (cupin superfamily)